MNDDSFENDPFDPRHLYPIGLTIDLENLTSKMKMPAPNGATVHEILSTGIIINVPNGCCATGHAVFVAMHATVRRKEGSDTYTFESPGTVRAIEKLDDGGIRVTLDLRQVNSSSWSSFLNIFSQRQNEITDFIKGAKGY